MAADEVPPALLDLLGFLFTRMAVEEDLLIHSAGIINNACLRRAKEC